MRKILYLLFIIPMLLFNNSCDGISTPMIPPIKECTEHAFEFIKTVLPTCKESGYDLYLCSNCGKEKHENEIDSLGHIEGDILIDDPTCIIDGKKTTLCAVCLEVYSEEIIKAAGHTEVVDIKEATCLEEGFYKISCSTCKQTLSEEKTLALGHIEHISVTSKATCKKEGTQVISCENCYELLRTETIPMLTHIPGDPVEFQATCTKEGGIKILCTLCFEVLENKTTPALGHVEVNVDGVEPTCEEKGYKDGVACDRCKLKLSGFEIVPALGHDGIYRETNMTELGHSYDVVQCSRCKYTYRTNPVLNYENLAGYKYLRDQETKGAALSSLYVDFYDACMEFSKSTKTYTAQNDETYKELKRFVIDCNYSSCASHTKYGLTIDEAKAVFSVFSHENPQFYFLWNGISYGKGVETHKYTFLGVTLPGEYTTTYMNLCISKDYFDYNKRVEIEQGMDNVCASLSNKVEEAVGTANKAKIIHDYITSRIDYTYDEDGNASSEKWAHNIVGIALNLGGVCETYAKTYQYLSYLFGINSLIVYGDNHAWNMTEVNGKWYGIDATWDDKGKGSVVYTYFGAVDATFYKDGKHTPYGQDMGFSYQIPVPKLGFIPWMISGNNVITN